MCHSKARAVPTAVVSVREGAEDVSQAKLCLSLPESHGIILSLVPLKHSWGTGWVGAVSHVSPVQQMEGRESQLCS